VQNIWAKAIGVPLKQLVSKEELERQMLQPKLWSGRRGSNPRPTAWEAVTLPLSYSRLTQTMLNHFLLEGTWRLFQSGLLTAPEHMTNGRLPFDSFSGNLQEFQAQVDFRFIGFTQRFAISAIERR
jgi:hypothetical protein